VFKGLPKGIILSVWAGWLLLILPRMVVPTLLPVIEEDFQLTHRESAYLMSSYMFAYALVQIPVGSLSDRLGKKHFIVGSICGTCIAAFLMAFAHSFSTLLLLRSLSGLMAGMYYAPSTAYIVERVDQEDVGLTLGLVFTGGSFSNLVITLLLNVVPLQFVEWQMFFIFTATSGILFSPILFHYLQGDTESSDEQVDRTLSVKVIWRELNNPLLIMLFFYNFLSSLSGWSVSTFLPTFFVLDRGFTVATASLLMTFYYVTTIFSGPLAGIAIRKFGLRIPSVITSLAMCLFTFVLPISYSGIVIVSLLILWGVLGGLSWPAYNALLLEKTSKRHHGTFLGLYNLLTFISGTIGPPIFGRVADSSGFNVFFNVAFMVYVAVLSTTLIIAKVNSHKYTSSLT
jgi:MFS family permease